MGDVLFHFLFPLIALLAIRVRTNHSIATIIGLSLAAVAMDIDHFLGFEARATFHNIFVVIGVPLVMFAIAMVFEKKGLYWKTISLALMVVLFSHSIADIFLGGAGVELFYPLSDDRILLNSVKVPIQLPTGETAYLVNETGIGILLFFVMLMSVIFIEDFLKRLLKYKTPEKALRRTVKYEEARLKKNL